MIGPWNCGALVVVFDHPPVLLLLGKRDGEVATDLLVMASSRQRVVWAEIDREPGKGKPVPSDHAPLVIDIDSPGHPFDVRNRGSTRIPLKMMQRIGKTRQVKGLLVTLLRE